MRPGAGTIAQLIELGRTRRIDWIIVARTSDAHDDVQALADRLRGTAAQIALWPGQMGHLATPVAPAAVGQRVLVDVLADRPIRRSNLIVKAAEDRVLGACITLLILPLLALIALAVRLDSPGPILFRQRRHALDNGEFEILKFRTMHQDAGPPGAGLEQTRRGDPRITRVGRWLREFSLDELPQLFNVLAGTMSLVGPRPHAVNMRTENRLGSEIVEDYAHRHRVKPGITGWAQVNGARGATDTSAQLERRVEFDLHYVENWSLWFDLKILAMTGRAVLRRTNAY
jgi:exopolysaccharide biosynthesis polyprenyl glycosylphosphotransferase